MRPNKLSARAIAKIKQDWIAGVSMYDLAAEHDVGPKAIWYHVKDVAREATPPKGRPRSFDHAKVVQLRLQGLSAVEIAERFGASRFHIWRVLRESHSRHNQRKAAA